MSFTKLDEAFRLLTVLKLTLLRFAELSLGPGSQSGQSGSSSPVSKCFVLHNDPGRHSDTPPAATCEKSWVCARAHQFRRDGVTSCLKDLSAQRPKLIPRRLVQCHVCVPQNVCLPPSCKQNVDAVFDLLDKDDTGFIEVS